MDGLHILLKISECHLKNFALELTIFRFIHSFKDGISFLELKCSLDLFHSDHKHSFDFSLIALNLMIFKLNIYNVNHVE